MRFSLSTGPSLRKGRKAWDRRGSNTCSRSKACPWALEARAPFLDYTFVEFVNAIPFGLKLKGLKSKYILKRAMAGILPPDILRRRKKGFGIPVAKWFRGELRDLLLDTLAAP